MFASMIRFFSLNNMSINLNGTLIFSGYNKYVSFCIIDYISELHLFTINSKCRTFYQSGCNMTDPSLSLGCESRWRCLSTCDVTLISERLSFLVTDNFTSIFPWHQLQPTCIQLWGPGRCMDVSGLWLHLKRTLAWAFHCKQRGPWTSRVLLKS